MRISVREWQIIDLISEGYTDIQIANKLKIAEGTVRVHIDRIFCKTSTDGRITMLKAVGYVKKPKKFNYERKGV